MKKILIVLLLLLGLASGGLLYGLQYYEARIDSVNPDSTEMITFEIPPGTSPMGIGQILLDKGLIHDLQVYRLYLRLNDLGSQFKAGLYEMSPNMDLATITQLLSEGGNVILTVNITIPEGLALHELEPVITRQLDISWEDFQALALDVAYFAQFYSFLDPEVMPSLEGYLFPNTYNVFKDTDAKTLIHRMLSEFDRIYAQVIGTQIPDDMSLQELMSMAAIVEGEALLDEERPLVASVFFNRIEAGWRLESCATVQYALGERKSVLTYADLEVVSPYNTYRNLGLPPGPINSPGLASIEASLNPEESIYMFFLAKGDGSHYFTDNYQDFLRAKAKYIGN